MLRPRRVSDTFRTVGALVWGAIRFGSNIN